MAELDVLTLPLRGRRLVEASAGTGKTYAIGSLLLRALLGHGLPEPLPVDRLLVVTFTRAATMELRDRLRSRLVEAREAFRKGTHEDPFLRALLEALPDHGRAATLLGAALGQLDEAGVFTIHGFCHRVLTEAAFESGAVFDPAFVLDDGAYRERAARDFWRREVHPLAGEHLALLRERHGDPDALLRAVDAQLDRPGLVVRGAGPGTLPEQAEAVGRALGAVKRRWREDAVRAELARSRVPKAKNGPGGKPMLDRMDAWAGSDASLLAVPDAEGRLRGAEQLLRAYAREKLLAPTNLNKKGEDPAIDPFLDAVDAALAEIEVFHATVRGRALAAIRAGIEAAKREDRMIAPDDVLVQTAAALRGASGEAFAAHVRDRWPLAFIDEFQDTDPVQWAIFDALYPPGPETGLVLIGDPKQAIYAFRGADVFAYLEARDALPADARHEMDTNWRSSPEMLRAVEALYTAQPDPFAAPGIDFVRVHPRPEAQPGAFRRGGAPAPALTFWHLAPDGKGTVSATAARDALAAVTAREVASLLDGDTVLEGEPLTAGRIAVLVNDRHEAEGVRRALAAAGVASAWQSRDPVFATAEARDLAQVLEAVLEPRDERAVRAALATALLALPLGQLHRETVADEDAWNGHLAAFARYHGLWRDGGVLVMLRALLADHAVPRRLLAQPDGARRITDLRHLGELLQAKAAELGSMHRLLRWYRRALERREESETTQLRLEADGDLVRLVTVHGSKGLEYDLVVLPFGIRARPARDALFHEPAGEGWQAVLDLAPDETALARADEERLAEELRLLYVALTRARHGCFVGVANLREGNAGASVLHRTALGRLLLGAVETPVDDAALASALDARAAACPEVVHLPVDPAAVGAGARAPSPPALPPRARFTGRIDRSWRVTSYTALVADGEDRALRAGAQDEAHGGEGPGARAAEPEEPLDAAARFPRGARPGTCLHELLETWPTAPEEAAGHVRRGLARWGFGAGAGEAPEAVLPWLQTVRATPLGIGTDLAGLQRALPELEFHLRLGELDTGRLRALLAAYGYGDAPLSVPRMRGLLRGFVDLVFEHEGAFWIVDYKSNWLGPAAGAYDGEAMAAAVRAHRYDLQYLLYCVALRRLLRRRLAGADPEPFFGGVLYLFLRGLDGTGATGVFRDRPSGALLDALDALLDGREVPA